MDVIIICASNNNCHQYESNQPKWIEVALAKFPDNRHLWSCLSLFCIHSKPTPQSEEWIKEVIIQYFPIVDWSDHQAWCLHNAFIHSQKKFILSPESFWTVTSSLLATNNQESVQMNILYSWYPERIISSSTLETKIVQSNQRLHLESCPCLPSDIREKLEKMKGSTSLSSVLRRYYIIAAKALGMHYTTDSIRASGESLPIGSSYVSPILLHF